MTRDDQLQIPRQPCEIPFSSASTLEQIADTLPEIAPHPGHLDPGAANDAKEPPRIRDATAPMEPAVLPELAGQ